MSADDYEAIVARNLALAVRLRQWYETGRKGLTTLAAKEGTSADMVGAIEYWFKKGDVNLAKIIKDLEGVP